MLEPQLRPAFLVLTLLLLPFGPAKDPIAYAQTLPSLRQSLLALKGSYAWDASLKRYIFDSRPQLESLLGSADAELATISALVQCMDDMTPSNVALDRKPVPLGMVCYEGLTQSIYYEPVTRGGDIAANWAGYIGPKASANQLRAAKRAWAEVVKRQTFKRL